VFTVSVTEHKCVTDQTTFDTTCTSGPADGVTVTGGDKDVTTGADGTATVSVAGLGVAELAATRGTDIPSEVLDTCVGPESNSCPKQRGERIVGSPEDDKIKGTSGLDEIRSRGGDDTVDVRKGGADSVNCGAGKDTVLVKRATASDGLVIKGNCEKVKRG
jgi:Ca2+-binding RTX toxin-like protein